MIVFHINVHVYIYRWGGNKPAAHAGITSTISGAYHNMLTLPRSLIGSIANGQAGTKLLKQRGRKTLGENVSVLRRRRNVKNPNMTEGGLLSNKVEIDLNMLCPLMLYQITGEIYNTDVVTEGNHGKG